jgi:MOSC domain-containing protein YiiM
MDEVHPGLLKALAQNARGGVTCTVGGDGEIHLGDAVEILFDPPVREVRLPG